MTGAASFLTMLLGIAPSTVVQSPSAPNVVEDSATGRDRAAAPTRTPSDTARWIFDALNADDAFDVTYARNQAVSEACRVDAGCVARLADRFGARFLVMVDDVVVEVHDVRMARHSVYPAHGHDEDTLARVETELSIAPGPNQPIRVVVLTPFGERKADLFFTLPRVPWSLGFSLVSIVASGLLLVAGGALTAIALVVDARAAAALYQWDSHLLLYQRNLFAIAAVFCGLAALAALTSSSMGVAAFVWGDE